MKKPTKVLIELCRIEIFWRRSEVCTFHVLIELCRIEMGTDRTAGHQAHSF